MNAKWGENREIWHFYTLLWFSRTTPNNTSKENEGCLTLNLQKPDELWTRHLVWRRRTPLDTIVEQSQESSSKTESQLEVLRISERVITDRVGSYDVLVTAGRLCWMESWWSQASASRCACERCFLFLSHPERNDNTHPRTHPHPHAMQLFRRSESEVIHQ